MTAPRADTDTEAPTDGPRRIDYEAEMLRLREKAREARGGGRHRTSEDAAAEIEERNRRRAQERFRQAAIDAALAQIPGRYADARPDHPAVARWAHELHVGQTTDSLVILGPVGVGKTHQAYGAYRELARRGIGRCVAIAVPALLDGLRPGRPGTVSYEEVEGADLLLLDDFAAERPTDWTGETLYRLIDARWAHMRPTIITSNATPAQIGQQLGERVASRLAGMGRTVVLTGEDRRRASVNT